MTTSDIQQEVAKTLLGMMPREDLERHVSCNTVARLQVLCNHPTDRCLNILDQRTVVVVTVRAPSRRVTEGFCPNCWDKISERLLSKAKSSGFATRVESWDQVIFEQGDVDDE